MESSSYWPAGYGARIGRRRLLSRTLAGASILGLGGLAGCGQKPAGSPSAGQPAQERARAGGTYNGYVSYNPTLDPQKASAAPQVMVSGVYSRVFRFKTSTDPRTINNHDLEGDLGLSAESPDGITWTIMLRPDARFTDIAPVNGHHVEAEDVRATFARALDSGTPNPNRGSLGMIDPAQIEVPDNGTIIFKLRYPYSPFNKTLASPATSWILPREAHAGAFDPAKTFIGSGPFMLESVTPDVAYVYKKNPGWFEKDRPYVDGMSFAVIPDASQQLAQFTAGATDQVTLSIDDLDSVKQRNPRATVVQAQNGIPWPTFWQLGDPSSVFQDIRIRRAFSMAVDRETAGKVMFKGQFVSTVFLPAYLGEWAVLVSDLDQSTQQYYKFNPAESRKLLEAAGVADQQFTFVYVSTGPFSSPTYIKHAELISSMLNSSGIKTKIAAIDYTRDYIDAGKGSSQGYYDKGSIVFGGMSVYTEADEYLFGYWHSKSTNSHERLSDPKMDAMIEKQRTILDEAERLKASREIVKYIADQMYLLTSVGTYTYSMVQPRVRNYCWSDSLGSHTEMYAKLWLAE